MLFISDIFLIWLSEHNFSRVNDTICIGIESIFVI